MRPGEQWGDSPRDRVRPELTWFLRHAAVLRRWPVLGERWAHRVEDRRIAEERPPRKRPGDPGDPA